MGFRRRWPGVSYGRGEDWHYVGDTDEPAFQNGWDNVGVVYTLAFRIREAGVVDIQGYIRNTTPANVNDVIFTLPERYRPTDKAFLIAAGDDAAGNRHPEVLEVYTTGNAGDVLAPGNTYQDLYIAGQFFLSAPI